MTGSSDEFASEPPGSEPVSEMRTSSTHTTPRGPADLPIPGTKGAPVQFSGRASEVEQFLQHYERLCERHEVKLDNDKIRNITQYCARPVKEFLEGLASFTANDWTRFKKDLKEFYNADKDDRRFRLRDLDRYVVEARKGAIASLGQWRRYSRGFIRIGGWLRQQKKIDQDQYNTSFWQGIPKLFRDRLEQRLMSQNPYHDLSTPFGEDEIEKNAKALLRRDRFDRDRLPSDEEESDNDDEPERGVDSKDSKEVEEEEDPDSEDDEEVEPKATKGASKKKKAAKRAKDEDDGPHDKTESQAKASAPAKPSTAAKKGAHSKSAPTSSERAGGGMTDQDEEVARIIQQLSNMRLDDPAYPALYFRVTQMNPQVQTLVSRPLPRQPPAYAPPMPPRNQPPMRPSSQMPPPLHAMQAAAPNQPMAPPVQPGPYGRDAPPHMSAQPPARQSSPCYGCGNVGHPLYACPMIRDLEAKKVIRKNGQGKWEMADGSPILKINMLEPIGVAAQRQAEPPKVHFVAFADQSYLEERERAWQRQPKVLAVGLRTATIEEVKDEESDGDEGDDESETKDSGTSRWQTYNAIQYTKVFLT